VRVVPLTSGRWDDFVQLFGPRGACEGCWCMTPRLPRAEYVRQRGAGNRRAMKRLVERGAEPGLLAYVGGEPVGWIALGPREDFVRLQRSRIAKPVDDRPTWSIVCFFVRKDQRGRGLSGQLIEAAARYAKSRGARLLEAYPIEPRKKPMPAVFAWTGIASTFRKQGFVEVARRAPTRPVLRRSLGAGRG
jgi:GNAT superfamily N-acetyltransferase